MILGIANYAHGNGRIAHEPKPTADRRLAVGGDAVEHTGRQARGLYGLARLGGLGHSLD
ncbi:hypothetical protein ACIF83_04700 [Streptomyces sp. NPDC085866]|uniref:hypothetical protein n=1 Tax=Streptomyces sp. NPDC085866 TaxID=3365736 RepID=UPI0037D06DB2